MKENKFRKLEYILAIIIYGTIGCFSKFINLPSGLIVLSRGLIGSLFIILFLLIKKQKLDITGIKKNIIPLILGGVSLGLNWIFLFGAYNFTSVSNAILLNYLAPAIFIVVAIMFFKEKLKLYKIICVIISFIGLLLICGIFEGGVNLSTKGLIFGLLAATFYVFLLVFNKMLKEVDSISRTLVQLLGASMVMLPYAILTADFSEIVIDAKMIIFLAILGVVHTGIAYLMYLGSMSYLRAQTIAIYSYIEPALSVFLSFFILKENMTPLGFVGGGLILGGTLVSELIHGYTIKKHQEEIEEVKG